jgi:NADH-quinone oxidoreductase subunit A
VRVEIDKIRRGEHGVRSPEQAIAIGLSEARRAGVDLPPPKKGKVKESTRKSAEYAYGQHEREPKHQPRVARAVSEVLKKEPQDLRIARGSLASCHESCLAGTSLPCDRRAAKKAAQNLSRKPPSRRRRPIPRFSYIETPSCLVGCAAVRIAPAVRQGACSLPRSSDLAHLRPSSFMPSLLDQYLPLAVFMAVAAVISGALLVAPFLVAFKAPDPEKLSAYECGFNAFDDARMRFDVRFYLVSLLFIIFDLEVAFLFPWAVAFREVGAFGFWSMMIFLGVLTVGFIYEWRKGALEWD